MAVTKNISKSLAAATAMVLGVAAPPVSASAWDIELNTHYYDLVPGLTIAKPQIALTNQTTLNTTVNAKFTVDRVESRVSEFDSITGASQKSSDASDYNDTRREIVAGVTHLHEDWKIEAGYLHSIEKDYRSNAPSLVVSKDLHQRNTTIGVGYARNFDSVHGSEMPAAKDKTVDNYALTLTQVLAPGTLLQAGYTIQQADGFLGTGNRSVTLLNSNIMSEYLPSERTRQAVGIRLAQWFPTKTAVHLSYRKYQDDWDVASGTYQVLVHQYLSRSWLLRGEARYYDQSAAEFVKDGYEGNERYLTSAISLREFDATLYGIKLEYTPKTDLDWRIKGKWERYSQSSGLHGDVTMLSFQVFL